MALIPLSQDLADILAPYLPTPPDSSARLPFVTLTYAQSLDARIAKQKGERTVISHEETKTMTHYLRYHHSGILIGSGTALADDPGLNCRWTPAADGADCTEQSSPRPIILDVRGRWRYRGSKIEYLHNLGKGKAPIVVTGGEPEVRELGVSYLQLGVDEGGRLNWGELFERLYSEHHLESVMVEGGAEVLNQLLLRPDIVDSLVITIGSKFLGSLGVAVSPAEEVNLEHVNWWHGTSDSVLCGRLA
ncbi:AER037Cp [Eremothecium gossypii ATCC 10895]|uniref:2,5-diamino-6-ribosylamino-4(3H)-pyrimidinone 5'-phosphate reductase n=1 Tax=Eremothecium gossypii (strain ATCC 10895 / CBS 109.51 / FGSC 9923 / NRRL Y-1056) TaxID=284811 RepID=RIB7_EREGS|nr:AER037Cp [Eremothecium gossypii ATCC 10895]Q757H6.1 RecName: Full=2,5-diamino-6-ribosylamino-4(3H)-pyrimidinone 5'-phosphate reductase; Short=DAROPP reductase; Short=DARP reductase; AltName: Full=2,5-diamino-6-(5-phospho-D-ribosylamino)pyrimidin-4(3H)-one reductase; AltName: Full=2,5-diamino-6-ribitylamino-4(3H)-pyrimidinone 5'-phosphate synthase; Short=DARIPP synthase [Eremothecium gossypii ATCC 10895]AAS52721.1 AER037Cp [Eremothecium gossypii ATCC 10895]